MLKGPPLTSRRMAQMRHQSMIRFARFLQQELGEEEVIDLIKKNTEQRMSARAKSDLKRFGKSDFSSYISILEIREWCQV